MQRKYGITFWEVQNDVEQKINRCDIRCTRIDSYTFILARFEQVYRLSDSAERIGLVELNHHYVQKSRHEHNNNNNYNHHNHYHYHHYGRFGQSKSARGRGLGIRYFPL